jgi:hypothetical protein
MAIPAQAKRKGQKMVHESRSFPHRLDKEACFDKLSMSG